jgi:DNA polymerase-3 subunit alpha
MAANINSFRTELAQASHYISCCAEMGIQVLPPDINKSREKFTTEGDRKIRFGMSTVKNVGENAVLDILADRDKNGPYKSFDDFVIRASKIGVKRIVAESLILASCMDSFGLTRAQMVGCVQTELDKLAQTANRNIEGQLSLFDLGGDSSNDTGIYIPDIPEYPEETKLGYEKEMVGIYISGNPLEPYRDIISQLATFDTAEAESIAEMQGAEALDDNREVVMCGMVTSKKTSYTKKKTMIATIGCEDMTGRFEVMLYGKSFDTFNRIVEKNKPYIFIGRRQMREDSGLTMFADACYLLGRDTDVVRTVKSDRAYMAAVREAGSARKTDYPAPGIQTEQNTIQAQPVSKEPVQEDARPPQALRINYSGKPDSEGFNRLLNFLAYFHGNLPVEVKFTSDVSIARLDPVCDIMFDDEVIEKLNELVGSGNTEIIREA